MSNVDVTYLLTSLIHVNFERGIFFLKSLQCSGEVGGLDTVRFNGEGNYWFWHEHRSLKKFFITMIHT